MAEETLNAQPDLFEEPLPEKGVSLAPTQRAAAVEQLQALLTEAIAIAENGPGAGHDQDQA